ncbi:MAG: transcriptional repressor NrdR [Nitrospirae bacterium]|nr:transcriptional repressor NrdR [Nitrospirota bacterium]
MRCPYCGHLEDKVVDSRLREDGRLIRRRRECASCANRFTTFEQVEEVQAMVVKKDGSREMFNRIKILQGLNRACEKRPVTADMLENAVSSIERKLQDSGEREVSSTKIGEMVMAQLRELDEVAYVRFASVYRSFQDIGEFMTELKTLINTRRA